MKFVCRGEINFPSTSESADWLPLPRLFVGSPYKYQSTWFPILFIFPQCIIILHGHFDRSRRFIIILLLCTSYLLCLCHAGSAPHATQLKGGSDLYIYSVEEFAFLSINITHYVSLYCTRKNRSYDRDRQCLLRFSFDLHNNKIHNNTLHPQRLIQASFSYYPLQYSPIESIILRYPPADDMPKEGIRSKLACKINWPNKRSRK